MKKVIFSAAALLLASAFSFAGTPETKANTKPEAKPEVKTETTLVYHYTGKDAQGRIIFEEGPATDCPSGTNLPCEWEATSPMSSPQTPTYINSHASAVLQTRN
ncbi:hypothetical protein [Sphingobacterium siyangense]|uniref:hypothetical protein n=1 Tax=Sphingobacterium siyangense TaxID=459529 RepID=UPI003DA2EB05